MPLLRAPLFSLNARGRLGELFALVRRRRQNIIELRPIPADAKSTTQLFYRDRFTACVAKWHLLSEAEKQEWQRKAVHMTGYAAFMSYCLTLPPAVPEEMTFYPDAHPESTSVDGYVGDFTSHQTWPDKVGAAGTQQNDDGIYLLLYILADDWANTWTTLNRSILLFDTSALPDACTVTAATLYLYGSRKVDNLGISPTLNLYSSNPASDNALVNQDYATLGSIPFCDTPITYAAFKTGDPGDPNLFALNAAGLAAISKTGITKLGLREASYDVPVNVPAWISDAGSHFRLFSADKGGDYRPKLVVTYQ